MPSTRLTTARPGTAVERRPPRVGLISFLNCRPLLWGLERSGLLAGLDLVSDSPESVGADLVAGRLDLGPISLADYLRHTEDLLLLPGLAIAADGPVMSCNIVSRRPLEELAAPRVGLASTSRTTVLLARFLLEERFGLAPRYFTGPPDPDAGPAEQTTGAESDTPVAPPRWIPGQDVTHAEHGDGWVQGSGVGRVTVRFETRFTGPGRIRTFAVNDADLRIRPAVMPEEGPSAAD